MLGQGVPPGCILITGMLPEHTAGQHASSHSPSRGSTHDVPERRLVNTGTGATVHCRCASKPLKDPAVRTTSAPSSGEGYVSYTRLTHSADRDVAEHPWDRHVPTADDSKGSITILTDSRGQGVVIQLMRASHPHGPTTEATPFRQRSILPQLMIRADAEEMRPVPEPQQHGPIPV